MKTKGETNSAMADIPDDTPQAEHRHHTYQTHHIPFYVRLMWVGFYLLAIYYVGRYMFPSIQEELRSMNPAPAAKQSVDDSTNE